MRIAVIGSGAAAAATMMGLARSSRPVQVTLFDIGKKLPPHKLPDSYSDNDIARFYTSLYHSSKKKNGYHFPPIKTHFGKCLPQYKIDGKYRFFKSDLWGGLTNFWGGTMLPFSSDDFAAWPINYTDLKPYYQYIANHIGISGRHDALSKGFDDEYANRPPIHILKGLRRLDDSVNSAPAQGEYTIYSGVNRVALETRPDNPHRCIYCGECMSGCVFGSVYCAAETLQSLQATLASQTITGRVVSLETNPLQIQVAGDDGEIHSHGGFDRIFLCAGAPGTTGILMRSMQLQRGPTLIDNAVFQVPIINYGAGQADLDKKHYLSLSNLIFSCQPRTTGRFNAQVQIYPNFDYLWRSAIPEPLWHLAQKPVQVSRDRILWARIYLYGCESFRYNANLDSHGELFFTLKEGPVRGDLHQLMNSLRSVINRNGFHMIPIKPVLSKTSSHLAGTFPYGGDLVKVSRNGEVMPGVHICDSTCFPDSPAVSPTFTIMANALRTVDEALA